jgi:hypothetical protein
MSLLEVLRNTPATDFQAIVKFIELICLLKPTLRRLQASYQPGPPDTLPRHIHDFLMAALSLSNTLTKLSWMTLHKLAWFGELKLGEELTYHTKHIRLFLDHGTQWGIGVNMPSWY